MNIERWLPVVGYEGLYEVSDFGSIRSLPKMVRNRSGQFERAGTILRPAVEDGYLRVGLVRATGQRKSWLVHRVVLFAFVGPAPSGHECLHGDGVRSNCVLSNIRWGTKKENATDKERHGTVPKGERANGAALTDALAEIARASAAPTQVVADFLGVGVSTIWRIRRDRTYRSATSQKGEV